MHRNNFNNGRFHPNSGNHDNFVDNRNNTNDPYRRDFGERGNQRAMHNTDPYRGQQRNMNDPYRHGGGHRGNFDGNYGDNQGPTQYDRSYEEEYAEEHYDNGGARRGM